MDILIIGGTGVLSSAVVNVALKQGLKVTMINRGRRKNLIPEGVDVIVADKKDTKRIQSILKNRIFDAVMDFLCIRIKIRLIVLSFIPNILSNISLFLRVLYIILL